MIDKLNEHANSLESGLLFELARNKMRDLISVMCRLRDVLKIKIANSSTEDDEEIIVILEENHKSSEILK